jgi:hypothetical protein
VLTSTDYDWKQAEEATIVHCSDCSNKQIRVDREYLQFIFYSLKFSADQYLLKHIGYISKFIFKINIVHCGYVIFERNIYLSF